MRPLGFILVLCAIGAVPTLYFVATQLKLGSKSTNVDSHLLRTVVTQEQEPDKSWTLEKPRNWLQPQTQQRGSQFNAGTIKLANGQSQPQESQSANAFKPADNKDQPHQTNDVVGLPSATQLSPTDTRSWFPIEARSKKCRRRSSVTDNSSVSLVVDFRLPANGEAFEHVADRLRLTVNSLISGSQSTISELLIVGYGSPSSSSSNLAARLSAYTKNLQLPLVRVIDQVIRSQAAARMVAFEQSKGNTVVFSDVEVVGTVGWLRPLIKALYAKNSTVIAQPHFDDASRYPVDFQTTAERTIVEYIWPLTISVGENIEIVPSERTGRYKSPVVRGNIFAVRRNLFTSVGGYDDKLSNMVDGCPTAAHLELSLRTWMCGGRIETVPCSRVGIRDLTDRRKKSVLDISSARRIAQLWFGERSNLLLASVLSQARLRQQDAVQLHNQIDEQAAAVPVKRQSSSTRNCSNIDWYFKEVAKGARVPSVYAVKFGQLRAKAG